MRTLILALLLLAPGAAQSDDTTVTVTESNAGDDFRESHFRQLTELVHQLVRSAHPADRLAAAILAESPMIEYDADVLYRELLDSFQGNPLIIHRALAYCVHNPDSSICDTYDLTAMHSDADPGNGLPHLVDAFRLGLQERGPEQWDALRHASQSPFIRSHYPDEIRLFLGVMKRHPEFVEESCEPAGCPVNSAWVAAMGMAMALTEYSWAGAGPCRGQNEIVSETQTNTCLNLARLLQDSNHDIAVGQGLVIEQGLLEHSGADPQRLARINAIQHRRANILQAGLHASRKLDIDNNRDIASSYLTILLAQGEQAAMTELAKLAGISIRNPPPPCLEPSQRDSLISELEEEFDHFDPAGLSPPCPDYLLP